MDEVRCAVIGLGFFGEKHAEVLSDLPGVRLTALCTRRPQRLKQLANRLHVEKSFTDYAELLADDGIYVVNIVTHYQDHWRIAIDALEAGKHVFVEKPMASTVAECDAMLAAAAAAKGYLMVGHVCRFDPRVVAAKRAIDEGRLGHIVHMNATRNLPQRIGKQVLNKISALFGDRIHDTDLMLWFSNSKIRSVYAREIQVGNYHYKDGGSAIYGFANGASGVVNAIWALPDNTPYQIQARFEVIGSEGALSIDCAETGITINDSTGVHKPDTVYWPLMHGRTIGALRDELKYFTDCVRGGRAPVLVPPEDSRLAVEVLCAAEKSAAEDCVVRVD